MEHEFLSSQICYDHESGKFSWAKNGSGRQRSPGHICKDGYLMIMVSGKTYAGHRLAWFLFHKSWPAAWIDHADGNRSNNRIDNLRPATVNENARNAGIRSDNTSSIKGVCWHKRSSKWRAQIYVNGKAKSLGAFDIKDDAAEAYAEASRNLHGEYGFAARLSDRRNKYCTSVGAL